jgi:hypothetical protein
MAMTPPRLVSRTSRFPPPRLTPRVVSSLLGETFFATACGD